LTYFAVGGGGGGGAGGAGRALHWTVQRFVFRSTTKFTGGNLAATKPPQSQSCEHGLRPAS